MVEKNLPRMPRKVKKSKSRRQSKSKEKKKSNSKNKKRGISAQSIDSENDHDLKNSDESVKINVPIEILTKKQINMLKLAQNLKVPKFKINL